MRVGALDRKLRTVIGAGRMLRFLGRKVVCQIVVAVCLPPFDSGFQYARESSGGCGFAKGDFRVGVGDRER